MGKLNTSSTSDGQKFEKEEKGDDNMEQKQMEEEQKRWKTDIWDGERDWQQKGKAEDKPKHESEEEPNTKKEDKAISNPTK